MYEGAKRVYAIIEPWRKTLRSLALKGRRFENWKDIGRAVERATVCWNARTNTRLSGDAAASVYRDRPVLPCVCQLPAFAG